MRYRPPLRRRAESKRLSPIALAKARYDRAVVVHGSRSRATMNAWRELSRLQIEALRKAVQ